MSDNEMTTTKAGPPMVPANHHNPFARGMADHLAAGAVTIESERAIAEIQAKIIIAKRFPRDEQMCLEKVKDACRRPEMASVAFYSYSRGDGKVSGPSIRLAEELVRCWSNMDYGLKELSNRNGSTEMLAYAWDMENNNYSQQAFTVNHLRDTKAGAKELKEQRDIYEIGANMGARRMRARMLAILPDWYVNSAIQECRNTIANGSELPLIDRIAKMMDAFRPLGVLPAMVAKRIGHPLDQTTPNEFVDLTGLYRALRDGQTTVEDEFGEKPTDATAEAVKAAATAAPEPQPAAAKAKEPAKETEQTAAAKPAKEPAAAPAQAAAAEPEAPKAKPAEPPAADAPPAGKSDVIF